MGSLLPGSGPRRFLVYPLLRPDRPGPLDAFAARRVRFGPIKCPACGSIGFARNFSAENLRETGTCEHCNATNRQRQMAYMTCRAFSALAGRRVTALPEVARLAGYVVYNTEASGPVHDHLAPMAGYVCSEYFGPDYKSGELVGGVLHQDITETSFADASIDVVLSSDVLEHVPDPYRAHEELHRVLRPGGAHIFTVPFHQEQHLDDHRATLDDQGRPVFLKEPIYHGDPVRPAQGVLVYTIFALEMLVRLRELGYSTNLYRLYSPRHGILGDNAIIFEAIKVPDAAAEQ